MFNILCPQIDEEVRKSKCRMPWNTGHNPCRPSNSRSKSASEQPLASNNTNK